MTPEEKQRQREQFRAHLSDAVGTAVKEQLVDVTNAIKLTNDRLDGFEKKMEEDIQSRRSHSLPGASEETHNGDPWSFGKVLRGLQSGDLEGECPMEYAMSRDLFAQGTVSDTAGGFLVPTEVFEDQIIPLLRPRVIAMDLGVTTLPVTGAGTIEIPRETTGPQVDAVAENQANTDSDMAFGNMQLSGYTAQSFIKASRKFLKLGVGADNFIRSRMAQELALKWNEWILKGLGADGEPTGVFNAAGIGSVSFSGVVSTGRVLPTLYKKLLAMEDVLADANAMDGADSLGWAMANRALRAMRQIESDNNSAGTSNLEMDRKLFSSGEEQAVLGHRYRRSTQLAQGSSTDLILGDWSKVVFATWNNLSIEASNVANDALQKRQTHIVAYIDVDVAVTRPESFCVATGFDTSSL